MSIEYEHNGFVYHEPLPRVLLANFGPNLGPSLKQRSHNVKICESRVPAGGGHRILSSPCPSHETDIILVRDQKYQAGPPFAGNIEWPEGHFESFANFVSHVASRYGACVFFAGVPPAGLHGAFNISPVPSNQFYPGRSVHRLPPAPGFEPLSSFVARHVGQGERYVGLHQSNPLPVMTPLLEDASGVLYACAGRNRQSSQGLVLFLPDFGEEAEIFDELLSDVLPQVMPHLFPFRHDLSWLKEREFRHPRILELEEVKDSLLSETATKLADIDQRIKGIDETESYLRDLITTAGDQLKNAVNRVLCELFKAAGISDAMIVDVDADPQLRGGDSNKREDLRVEWANAIFLLNVGGREQFFRPTSLNQLSQHHRLFVQGQTSLGAHVHSLLMANFNYAAGMDPRKRGDMFGSGTADARERLLAEGHGAISTFDLYRLIRAVQKNEIQLQAETVRKLLRTEGILDFETFLK